jgi:hypothetical protein
MTAEPYLQGFSAAIFGSVRQLKLRCSDFHLGQEKQIPGRIPLDFVDQAFSDK